MFDFHTHYTNWKQDDSDFFGLERAMDEAGVRRAVICGLPTKVVEDKYVFNTETDLRLLEHYRQLPARCRRRFLPFLCGVNPEDPATISHIEQLIERSGDDIFGIGEVICRHDAMSLKIFGKEIPPNTDTMLKLSDLASEHGLPILLHSNVAKLEDTKPRYLNELEDFFSHNLDTKIVWAHCGISKELNHIPLEVLLETLKWLFDRHKNIFVDLTWRVFDYYIDGMEQRWVKLISEYPERFLLGTDLTGKWQKYTETVRRYEVLLALLPEQAREMVNFVNATKLIPRYYQNSLG